jgi:hypothetical protein
MRWYDSNATVVEATLREARANHYYPSVTTILDVINKPAVEIWKRNIVIDEAMKLNPIFAEHEIDEFKETVNYRAGIKFSEAAELGTKWHRLLVDHLLLGLAAGESEIPAATLHAIDEKLKDLEIHLEQHEIPFVNKDDGYAGTIDAIGYRMAEGVKIPIVLDWKTQGTNGKSPRYYDTWPMQLAAYSKVENLRSRAEIWNVVLSTTDPGRVWFKGWSHQDYWWEAFYSAHIIWCTLNNYNPRSGKKWFQDEHE